MTLEQTSKSVEVIADENDLKEESDLQREIGLAISHYHHKLGPRFVGISYDFTNFDSLAQYNILQDSISSRSEELALFIENKSSQKYIIHIKKIKILDPAARGGVQRYAVVLFIPAAVDLHLQVNISDVAEDFKEKLSMGENIENVLRAWHTLINDMDGVISDKTGEIRSY